MADQKLSTDRPPDDLERVIEAENACALENRPLPSTTGSAGGSG